MIFLWFVNLQVVQKSEQAKLYLYIKWRPQNFILLIKKRALF